jgi:hypothetical protein
MEKIICALCEKELTQEYLRTYKDEMLSFPQLCKECLYQKNFSRQFPAIPEEIENKINEVRQELKTSFSKEALDEIQRQAFRDIRACDHMSNEVMMEHVARKIREKNNQIRNHFLLAYIEEILSIEGDEFCLDDICLVEQEPHLREGCITRRYWFELKPKYNEEDPEA